MKSVMYTKKTYATRGQTDRVSDEAAFKMVQEGKAVYVPKHVHKQQEQSGTWDQNDPRIQ